MGDNGNILELNGVTKTFFKGKVDEVKALDNVSLKVKPEDYVTIIGSNGAGKTTLLNVIAGTFPPEEGRVVVKGEDVTDLPEYKRAKYIGRVHQDPKIGTGANLTIEENLAFAASRGQARTLRMATNQARRKRFRELLEPLGLGLEKRLGATVGTLSSGQRQSIAMAMATMTDPALLLLDEHTANLDPNTAQTVFKLTEMIIKRERLTTLMITHNMDIAICYGNRLIMMHRGRIVVDIGQAEKQKLTVKQLVEAFEEAAGTRLTDESILLSRVE